MPEGSVYSTAATDKSVEDDQDPWRYNNGWVVPVTLLETELTDPSMATTRWRYPDAAPLKPHI